MSVKRRLLIVDDEPNIRRILAAAFDKAGWVTAVAEDAHAALAQLSEGPFDAMLTDVTMPGMRGDELLVEVKRRWPEVPVVVMTAYGTIPQAIQAIRAGAADYVTKPFDLEALRKVMAVAVENNRADRRASKKPSAGNKGSGPAFIAESPEMQEIRDLIPQIADSRATVLVTGESGTGKEVVAKLVHAHSPRSDRSFIAFSCAAVPETLLESELFGYEKGAFTGAGGDKAGRFELANGGTLFLDEIGEVPLTIQAKLLRVLQEREFDRLGATRPTQVDVRLVTATNRDLSTMVDQGTFRLDLLYRLQVIEIHIPPLRERTADILPLAEYFLAQHALENERPLAEIGPDAARALLAYSWPGNVRELGNVIERAVVLAKRDATVLDASVLPRSVLKTAA